MVCDIAIKYLFFGERGGRAMLFVDNQSSRIDTHGSHRIRLSAYVHYPVLSNPHTQEIVQFESLGHASRDAGQTLGQSKIWKSELVDICACMENPAEEKTMQNQKFTTESPISQTLTHAP
jgi:hypothetical protein